MSEVELDYKEDLLIDINALDEEWLDQPNLFMRYAEASAQAEKELRRMHEKVKTIRSELVFKAFSEGTVKIKDKEAKVVGSVAEAYYRINPDYRKAKQELIRCEHTTEVLRGAVSAFHQRRAALERLVMLHGQQYFAGPNVPHEFPSGNKVEGRNRKAAKRTKSKRDA